MNGIEKNKIFSGISLKITFKIFANRSLLIIGTG
jgi:hypothetical protein